MSRRSGRKLAALGAVVALLCAGLAVAAPAPGDPAAGDHRSAVELEPTRERPPLVVVDPNSSEALWPYTSRAKSTDSATLPINVVVTKNAGYVRYLLGTSSGATWHVADSGSANETGENASAVESGVVFNGTNVEWTEARGSTRYTYIHDRDGDGGRWVEETYQLHDGSYLGTRYHLRLYEGGAGSNRWTAIQAHREHWDWFRLRHTVDSVDRAQDYVEGEFLGSWFLESMARDRFANGGALDSDGWVSIIRLTDHGLVVPPRASIAAVAVLFTLRGLTASAATRRVDGVRAALADWSVDPRYVALVGGLALLPPGVRVAGITLEGAYPWASPKVFAAVLYLVLAVGVPGWTFALARLVRSQSAPVASATAFGLGMLADYAYLDIAVLPIDVIAHRVVLLVAVGAIAAGSARTPRGGSYWNPTLAAGVALWIVGLIVPLFEVPLFSFL